MALLGLRIFLKPTSVYSGVLLGGFQCFSNSSIFFNGIHPNFLFFFTSSAKRGNAADMLVLSYYSDLNNGNLDYALK